MASSVSFPSSLQPFLDHVIQLASQQNHRVVVVGGVVRDLLLKRPVFDVDLMTDHPAEEFVKSLAKELDGKFIKHDRFLTFTIDSRKEGKIDIVTARTESYPKAGQLPVVTPAKIEDDLARRDFTINAMACWLSGGTKGTILDPFDGQKDLSLRKVRVLHPNSFHDDPTRIFRAARFAGRFGFHIEADTLEQIEISLQKKEPAVLSPTRRRHEFELILKEVDPVPAIRFLQEWGALSFIDERLGQSLPNLNELNFKKESDWVQKLALWFQGWKKGDIEAVLNDLAFERSVKRQVLDLT